MINYLKVVDIVMKICMSEGKPVINAQHDKTDIYDLSFTDGKGATCACRILFTPSNVTVSMPKSYFPDEEGFQQWSRKFEFEMEQEFLSNFVIKYSEDASSYKTNASF